MTSQSEIRQLIDQSRQQGAIVRTWHERDDSISRIQVRSGVPGVGPGWMPVIQAAEKLRQFVFAMQGA